MKVTVHVVVQAGDDTDAPTVVREESGTKGGRQTADSAELGVM
jgi:hypothetical protein